MKQIKLLFLVIGLFFSACNTPTNKVKINGVFENLKSEYVTLESTSDSIIDLKILVKEGKFDIEFELEQPVWLELRFPDDKCSSFPVSPELFLEPGDNIELKAEGSDIYRSITATGRGNEENNFLFSKYNIYYPDCSGWPPNKSLEAKEFLGQLNDMKRAFAKSMKKYNQNKAMNKHFVDLETRKDHIDGPIQNVLILHFIEK